MFGRLCGYKSKSQSVAHSDDAGGMIEAYDQHGNKVLIERGEYRTRILPGIFQDAWNDADRLYGAIVMALNDGFLVETVAPAERLRDIDHIEQRSATILGKDRKWRHFWNRDRNTWVVIISPK